jgi:hypothetical protein
MKQSSTAREGDETKNRTFLRLLRGVCFAGTFELGGLLLLFTDSEPPALIDHNRREYDSQSAD